MPFPMMTPDERAIMELDKKRREGGMSPEAPTFSMSGQGGGFDSSDLMNKPAIRQEETRNQANMVSAPYEQANEMAFSKNNPMNAVSQDPGKTQLQDFIDRRPELKDRRRRGDGSEDMAGM